MKIPRLLLAAPASGSGKTMLTCGLLKALINRGQAVRSFKCGPDFIDPLFHGRILGTACRNLDSWFSTREQLLSSLARGAQPGELTLIEGVMGYYDGLGGVEFSGSTYDIARKTQTPVVLVIDGRGASRSLSALIGGMKDYRADSGIAGVICNRVSGGLFPALRELIEREHGIPVLGYLPRMPEAAVESRYLGLTLPSEIADIERRIEAIAVRLAETVDLAALMQLAEQAPEITAEPSLWQGGRRNVRLALAQDEAFCFIYEDNRELLREMGAELIPFSPLRDAGLPEGADGLILPGGYPELFAGELSENVSMREAVRAAAEAGMPLLAECGGFLYLHRELADSEGTYHPMAGVIDAAASRRERMDRFGYASFTARSDTVIGPAGTCIRGHEYHYYESSRCGEAFLAQKPAGGRQWKCLHADGALLAGFPHLYYPSAPECAWRFVEAAAHFGGKR